MNLTKLRQPRWAASLAIAAALGIASPASAAVDVTTCSLANGVLTVDMRGNTTIDYASSVIVVHSGQPRACTGGLPTTLNTDAVRIVDHTDNLSTPEPLDGTTTLTIRDPASYRPGRTVESGSASELEFVANMNGGSADTLVAITDQSNRAYWTAGTLGINWNGDNDPDLYGAFDRIEFSGSRYSDQLSARGGKGTGDPLSAPTLRVDAGDGDDELLGGNGNDQLEPGPGNDVAGGFGGDDHLNESPGDDSLAGGPGTDTVSFTSVQRPVSVDLATAGPVEADGTNIVADFETVFGTSYDDTLVGTEGTDHLVGLRGEDTLTGRGGADLLSGGEDLDTVSYAGAASGISADLSLGRVKQGTTTDELQDVEGVIGSPFADDLVGNGVANLLVGGAGADRFIGGNGADRLEIRDGEADTLVTCGDDATTDIVVTDRRGLDPVNADCETIDFAPEPEPEPAGQPAGGTGGEPTGAGAGVAVGAGGAGELGGSQDRTLGFTLSGSSAQRALALGFVRVHVGCPQAGCSTVITATPVAASRTIRRVQTVRKTVVLTAGGKRVVKLTISRALRRALSARRKAAVNVRAEAVDAAGNRAVRLLRVRVTR